MNRAIGFAVLASALAGCSGGNADQMEIQRKDEGEAEVVKKVEPDMGLQRTIQAEGVEAIGGVAMARVDAPDFEKLPLKAKKLLYRNYEAALFCDLVYYRQLGKENLKIKRMMEAIASAGGSVAEGMRSRIGRYADLFWINHGVLDAWTGKRTAPFFIPGELAAAANAAMEKGVDLGASEMEGAKLGANRIEELEALLAAVRPSIFDLNASLDTADAGTEKEDAPELETLARMLGSDDAAYRNDGVEIRTDPESGAIAVFGSFGDRPGSSNRETAFGAIAGVEDRELTEKIAKAANRVVDFQRLMPYESRFKVLPKDVVSPEANAIETIVATGWAGPVSQPLISIRVDRGTKRPQGRKILYLANVVEAFDRAWSSGVGGDLALDAAAAAKWSKCSGEARFAFLTLRELMGKGEWKPGNYANDESWTPFAESASLLEEMRADLAALYLALDPLSKEIGLLPDEQCATSIYDVYFGSFNALNFGSRFGRDGAGTMAKRSIVQVAFDAGAAEIANEGGLSHVRVLDYSKMRSAIAEMLGRIQRALVLRDREEAESLARLGSGAAAAKWDEACRSRLSGPRALRSFAFFFPLLVSKHDKGNDISDVELFYPSGFTERQLMLARKEADSTKGFKAD